MELTQLRYFLDVAGTEHITASAQRLHIAQPALTQTIHRLEKDLGVRLFTAKGRGIALTECGRYLRDRLTPLFSELDTLPLRLQALENAERETVRLSVLAATSIVTEAVIRYKTAHPSVNFRLLQNPGNEPGSGGADMEISTRLPASETKKEPASRFIIGEKIYLAAPAQGKFGDRRSIRFWEVEEEGFISLLGSRPFRAICDKLCRRAGFSPKMIFESDSPDAVKNMIAAGLGVGFWPEFTWGSVDRSQVRLLEIEDIDFRRELLLTAREDERGTPDFAAGDFFLFLRNFFEEKRRGIKV